jgi:hypothetical protein
MVWEARDRKVNDFLRRQQEVEEQQQLFSAIKQKQLRPQHRARSPDPDRSPRYSARDERDVEYSFAYGDDEEVQVPSRAGVPRAQTQAALASATATPTKSPRTAPVERGPVFTQGSQQSKEALIAVGLLSPEPPPPPSSSYTVPASQRKLYLQQRNQQLLQARLAHGGSVEDSFTSLEPRESQPRPAPLAGVGPAPFDVDEVEQMIDSVLGAERPSTPPPPPPLAQFGFNGPEHSFFSERSLLASPSTSTSMEQDSVEVAPAPAKPVFVLRVNEAFQLAEGLVLGELKPYVVFDWDFLGRAHTQAVAGRGGAGGDEESSFCFNSTLKFRTPKLPPNATENRNQRLYTLLSHAPALQISIYNRNDSVSDEKLGEVLIPNVIELYLSKNPHNVAPLKTSASYITSENLGNHVVSQSNGIRGCLVQCDQLNGTGDSAGCVSFDILVE